MKVGIVGDATRGLAWEGHLRPHSIVRQVDIAPSLNDLDNIDACFILDESGNNLEILLEAIHKGFNCFFIARQPTDIEKLEKIHRAAKEAGVFIQFAHWPTLAPATQWMMDKISRPSYIHIDKEVNRNQLVHISNEFRHLWIDELGLCLKWVDSGVHHLEAKEISLVEGHPVVIHLFLRFDNGSTATINIYTGASDNRHKRIISTKKEIMECDVPSQTIKLGHLNPSNRLFFEKQSFDPAKSAEKAALLFLKAIQLNRETSYTSYDALRLAIHINKVEQRLSQFA
jgi:predicted dehydrogenase